MRKRVCSLALCLTMALSLVTVPAWAEEEETAEDLAENPPVEESRAEAPEEEPEEEAPAFFALEEPEEGTVKVGKTTENDYYTFEDALDLENVRKLVLEEDIDVTSASVNIQKEVTLDLNGHDIKAGNTRDSRIFVAEGGTLTLTDGTAGADGVGGGKIYTETDYTSVDTGFPVVSVYGTFIMESGCIEAVRPDAANKGQFALGGNGKIEINNGKIRAGWYALACNGAEGSDLADFTVNGGVLESTADYAIYFPQSTQLTINGGEITGATGAVAMNDGKLKVNGGTLVSKGNSVTGEWSDGTGHMGNAVLNFNGKYGEITADIEDGTFTAEGDAVIFIKKASSATTVSIRGGEFNALDCLNYLAGDAEITVKLAENTVQDVVIPAGSAVTLDLNGNTLTNAASAQDMNAADKDRKHTITNKGTLTLTGGGTVDNVSHGRAALYNSGTVTIDDVTLTRSAEKGSTPQDNGGNSWYVVYNNGTIEEITKNAVVTSDSYYSSLICNCGTAAKQARIEKITGGAFSHNFVILKNDDYSYVGEISGGTFTVGAGAKETATILNFGTIGEISGGTFTNDGEWIVLRCSNWAGTPAIVGEATITGGTFTVADGGTVLLVNQGSTPGTAAPVLTVEGGKFTGKVEKRGDVGTLKVSGGCFSEAVPDACLAEGYAAVDTGAADYPFVIAKTYKAAFTVTPEGAKVEVKNGDAAVPANEDGTYTLNTAGIYTYSVSAEGYVTKTGAITAPAEGDTVTIEVALSTEPAKTAQVTFAVTPKDAKVEVKDAGGAAVEANADGTYTLNLGETYTYTVSASGYTAKDGKILPDKDSLTVTVELSKKTSGGGGGGGSSSSGTTTETTTNKDGSTTTTVTDQKTGTVTETTKEKDGTVTTVETTKDGTVTETVKTPDGVTGAVVTEDGEVVKAAASVSASAAKEAAKSGEAVTLPLEVPAADSTKDAPAVTVSVPKSVDSVKVEVPVEKVTPGTVAVIVHADGTEEIVKTSVVTEAGVALVLEADATLKIVDNSKDFADVPASYWAADAVDYVASRELFNGTGADTFTPAAPMTRAMLMTVLARLDGADTSGEAFAKGMAWAVEKGVSDGTEPDGTISRQQLAVMLWRYAGAPAAEDTALDFTDAGAVADYAAEAMRWAVGSGILSGTADGALNPEGQATRAHVAAMLMRFNNAML